MSIDPGSLPGRSASLDFGEASEFDRERKAIESAGSPAAPPQAGPPQTGASGQPPLPGAPPPNSTPTQPPPRQPLRPEDLRPGGPVFSAPRLAPTWPWRRDVRIAADHPHAGPALTMLRRTLDADDKARSKRGGATQQ